MHMIKIIIVICLLYFAYRLFVGPPLLSETKRKNLRDQDSDEDFTDYEEIE